MAKASALTTSAHKDLTVEDSSPVKVTATERAELVARVDRAKVGTRAAVIEAAKVTAAVMSSGLIGSHAGAEWKDQGDYAARGLGVSGGTLSGLIALGTAMERGLGEDHTNFEVVYANRQSIGKAAKDPNHKGFSHIVTAAKHVAAGRKADGTVKAVTSATESAPTAPPVAGDFEPVRVALDLIRDAIPTLSRGDARALLNSLATLSEDAGKRVKDAPAETEDAGKATA